ncbi:MAG: hypothetical protein WBF93_03650 [Pirellulales bacterium]|nr:hypothetical protein [Pirellulales bacterium]
MWELFEIKSATHILYLLIAIGITIWVARTLRIRGRIFLAKGCKGNEELTESLSHLLSVGYYLLHVGFVLLALKAGGYAIDTVSAIELLSSKIGLVLMVLGFSHFVHLALYARIHGKPRAPGTGDFERPVSANLARS